MGGGKGEGGEGEGVRARGGRKGKEREEERGEGGEEREEGEGREVVGVEGVRRRGGEGAWRKRLSKEDRACPSFMATQAEWLPSFPPSLSFFTL